MNNSLLRHIYTEFRLGQKFSIDQWHLLHESEGQVFGIDNITDSVAKFLSNQEIGTEEKTLIFTEKDIPDNSMLHFDRLLVVFNVTIDKSKPNVHNGYFSGDSGPRFPKIQVNANGEDIYELIYQCNNCLCHELIHYEENSGLYANTGKTISDNHQQNNGYKDYVSVLRNTNIQDNDTINLFKMLYWTDFGERKAFYGNLYAELKKHEGEFFDSERAYEVLHKTEAWKGYKRWEATVEMLNNISGNPMEEERILYIYNNYCKRHPMHNYPEFLRMVNRRWRKMKLEMEEKVSKILYRVYTETDGYGGTVDFDEY